MLQEELPHEQELPAVPRAAKRTAEACGSRRDPATPTPCQHTATWADWADCRDSSDTDDTERAQTAGCKIWRRRRRRHKSSTTRSSWQTSRGNFAMRKRRKQKQDHGAPRWTAHWRTRRKRSFRSNAPKRRWNVPKTNCTRQGETAEVESQVQRLRELVAQDWEKTQQEPDDVTVLIQLTDELKAQLRTEQVPRTARLLVAQLQPGLRASAANRSRTVSRPRSVS